MWATVPTMVWRVCEHPARHDYDTSSVTSVAFGGSPSADELQRKVAETFPNVRSTANAYGLTETSSVATVIGGEDAKRKPWSVGPPVPTVEVQIVDALGNPLAEGETGEVCIRGPILMKGYWNKPEATAEAIDADGWLHTGDIGHLDDEGYLAITDRKKDMIIRGGENIYCVEIENRLVLHPAVADAAIIGVAHPELGEEVKAVVQVEEGASLTEDDVRRWVAAELADFKVPAHVELRPGPLPRNASGKLLKNVLRGEGRGELRRDHVSRILANPERPAEAAGAGTRGGDSWRTSWVSTSVPPTRRQQCGATVATTWPAWATGRRPSRRSCCCATTRRCSPARPPPGGRPPSPSAWPASSSGAWATPRRSSWRGRRTRPTR